MAGLIKSGNKYYIQFYNSKKHPQQKQIPTGTSSKTAANQILKKLEAEYVLGDFDPWGGPTQEENLQFTYLNELISHYIKVKSETDWRANTVLTNGKLFEKISRKIGHHAIEDINGVTINSFINSGSKAHATRVGYRAKISAFINWSVENGFIKQGQIGKLKINKVSSEQQQSINYFSKEDIETLVSYIDKKVKDDFKNGYQSDPSNAFWLIDFIHWQRLSGMRLSETLNLRVGDINTHTWEITIGNNHFTTKSNKKQILPIGSVQPLVEIVNKKVSNCSSKDDRIFGHVCRRHTHRIFKKYLKDALPDKKYLNIHSLRHTCCIELLRAGVPIYTVQRWLRHSDVKTTQKYADLLATDISLQVGAVFK